MNCILITLFEAASAFLPPASWTSALNTHPVVSGFSQLVLLLRVRAQSTERNDQHKNYSSELSLIRARANLRVSLLVWGCQNIFSADFSPGSLWGSVYMCLYGYYFNDFILGEKKVGREIFHWQLLVGSTLAQSLMCSFSNVTHAVGIRKLKWEICSSKIVWFRIHVLPFIVFLCFLVTCSV